MFSELLTGSPSLPAPARPLRTKYVYVVRNGADVAVSLFYHMNRCGYYNFHVNNPRPYTTVITRTCFFLTRNSCIIPSILRRPGASSSSFGAKERWSVGRGQPMYNSGATCTLRMCCLYRTRSCTGTAERRSNAPLLDLPTSFFSSFYFSSKSGWS